MLNDPNYDPNFFIDKICVLLGRRSDRQLAFALGMAPPIISNIRRRKQPIGTTLLARLHYASGVPVKHLHGLMFKKIDPSLSELLSENEKTLKSKGWLSAEFNREHTSIACELTKNNSEMGHPDYDPNFFINKINLILGCKNDRQMCLKLGIAPDRVSRIRHYKIPVGAALLTRLHEVTGLKIKHLRALMLREVDPSVSELLPKDENAIVKSSRHLAALPDGELIQVWIQKKSLAVFVQASKGDASVKVSIENQGKRSVLTEPERSGMDDCAAGTAAKLHGLAYSALALVTYSNQIDSSILRFGQLQKRLKDLAASDELPLPKEQ